MRGSMPSLKGRLTEAPKYEDFKPSIEWTQDPSSHILLVHLPGFKRADIRVQLDNSGKLIVRGKRQVSESRYLSLDQSFDVPKDTSIDKISARFEDERLTLIMPKKAMEEQEVPQKTVSEEKREDAIPKEKPKSGEEKKDEESIQKTPKSDEDKKDESIQKEKSQGSEEKKHEPIEEEKPQSDEEKKDGPIQKKPNGGEEKKDESIQKEKPQSSEEKKHEPIKEEKPQSREEKKDEEPIQKEKPKIGGEKDEEPIQKEKPESVEEKKYDTSQKEKSESNQEKKKEDSILKEKPKCDEVEMKREEEPMQKEKSKRGEAGAYKAKQSKKRGSIWRDAENGWLDYGPIDCLLEKMNRNRKVIAVAFVAFSVGFYVSHKLTTSRR